MNPAEMLREIGETRRELGVSVMADDEFLVAAHRWVDRQYAKGEFGEQDRDKWWLGAKILDLAEILDCAAHDWLIEARKS